MKEERAGRKYERKRERKDTKEDMMKKCKGGESNTRREDIYGMRSGVGLNLDRSTIVAL
jgi:hypothetical protein